MPVGVRAFRCASHAPADGMAVGIPEPLPPNRAVFISPPRSGEAIARSKVAIPDHLFALLKSNGYSHLVTSS